ncbi:MAG: flavodoxin-dependent (E)-4-hydroxy-3-methylbut-2-enyl-diphosphate synthase [Eubacteriales bacterium]
MDYNKIRRKTRSIAVGSLYVGGDSPITVQSMTNTDTHDFEATIAQVRELVTAGCDIVRLAVSDMNAVSTIYRLKEEGIKVPLVADIHFDYKIALECVAAGIDKIRINPGNIGSDERVRAVVNACRLRGIPIRIGVNSGSLDKAILAKYGSPTAEALAESALSHVHLLEQFDFHDIIIAIKSSDPKKMIDANRIVAALNDYPLHLGVTEAGTPRIGVLRSAVGIGALLCEGIGDTIRISLTAPPSAEVAEGRSLLAAVGIASAGGVNIISCPTCGRTKIDIIALAGELERRSAAGEIKPSRPVTVAVMGCAVNGPGEASEADIGIAGGSGEALLFKSGRIIGKIPEDNIIKTLIDEINKM